MKRVLLVIDVQNEYFTGKLPITYPKGSFQQILKAIDAANQAEIPVVLIRHEAPQEDSSTFCKGSDGWKIHREILQRPHAAIVDKQLPGSFTHTGLEALLKTWDIDCVTISGFMTQMCCDTTARQACHLGFTVEFLSDATGTLDVANSAGRITAEELQRAILVTQAMRFSTVLSTDGWIHKVIKSE